MKRLSLFLALPFVCSAFAHAQAPAKASCTAQASHPFTAAEEAFEKKDYANAETLYRAELDKDKSPATSQALVRTLLEQSKVDEAFVLARRTLELAPRSSEAVDAMGEVRYRTGELPAAGALFLQATQIDPCLPRAHFDLARYMRVAGVSASAERQLRIAHQLAPHDAQISSSWESEHPSHPSSPDASCSVNAVPLPLSFPVVEFQWERFPLEGIGIDLQLDGHRTRFQVDT